LTGEDPPLPKCALNVPQCADINITITTLEYIYAYALDICYITWAELLVFPKIALHSPKLMIEKSQARLKKPGISLLCQ